MGVNGISGSAAVYTTSENTQVNTKTTEEAKDTTTKNDQAAVYEKSEQTEKSSTSKIYSKDSVDRSAIVKQLKADQEARMASLQSLVEKLLSGQGKTFNASKGWANQFREAAKVADPATILQAQKDVAEDGYWGVEQTSERLYQMAIALSGGDTSKADTMIEAMKKGFKQATQAWGEDLPDICQQTIDRAIEKVNAWKKGEAE